MDPVLIKVIQFFLSLSLLIVLHELGHFIPARMFGTRVEKFFLFFDIKFALFQKKIGETVYGIGWLPLGTEPLGVILASLCSLTGYRCKRYPDFCLERLPDLFEFLPPLGSQLWCERERERASQFCFTLSGRAT